MMNLKKLAQGAVLAGSLVAGLATANAGAQDMPQTNLKVVGSWGNLTMYKDYELPFWTKEIEQKSKGAVSAEITPFNEMGLKGAEIFRLMRLGVIDIGSTVLGYVAADDARNERSEEHTSELQSLMRISYAVFCLKKKQKQHKHDTTHPQ